MNDDFAPRPCRCVAERVIAVVLLAGLLIVAVLAWNMWRERDAYRDALAISSRVVDERNATIDELRTIIRAHEATPYVLPDGELEDGKMGARIIPQVRDLTREANEAVIEVREFVRDVKEGRLGAHVEGSLWKGTADVTLRKQP